MKNKSQRLNSFLENIECISDLNYQNKVWVHGQGTDFDDIEDSICDFFDDGEAILDNYQEFGISEIQYEKLINLREKLREFADTFHIYSTDQSIEELINLPEWKEIVELAKQVLIYFNKSLPKTSESKKYILEEFLRNILSISDKEYQKRVWISGKGPEADDFDETVCHFFHEGDAILDSYAKFGITENQYALLKQFRDTFEKFSDEHYLPEEFIDTPQWAKIMEMAKEVLKTFGRC